MPGLLLSFLFLTLLALFLVGEMIFQRRLAKQLPSPLLKKMSKIPGAYIGLRCSQGIIIIGLFFYWVNPEVKTWIVKEIEHPKRVMIVLDISKSMKTDDISPNRLARAKEGLKKILENPGESEFGLSIFAGRTFLMSPIGNDVQGMKSLLHSIDTDTLDQTQADTSGTNIGDALMLAHTTLKKSGTGESIILLVTDGRANTGIDPEIALKTIQRESSTKIVTLAVGTISGSVLSYMEGGIRQYFYNPDGSLVVADIDADLLQKLARETGGAYFHGDTTANIESLFPLLRETLENKKMLESQEEIRSLRPPILIAMTLFFIISIISSGYLFRKYKVV